MRVAITGMQVFNITGDNFGPLEEDVVWWVRYSPLAHPEIIFEADCELIVAHTTLRCLTGPQVRHLVLDLPLNSMMWLLGCDQPCEKRTT